MQYPRLSGTTGPPKAMNYRGRGSVCITSSATRFPVGVALMFVPQTTMNFLLTNHAYDDLGLRMFGVLLFSLGIIASGMIINKASSVYTVTLFVRGFIIAALYVLYSLYGDPALLAVNLVVTVGWALTFLCWRKDKATEINHPIRGAMS